MVYSVPPSTGQYLRTCLVEIYHFILEVPKTNEKWSGIQMASLANHEQVNFMAHLKEHLKNNVTK